MQCPVSLKLKNIKNVIDVDENDTGNKTSIYFQKTNDGKQILRNMMSHLIPSEITKATKKGFSSPDASWFKGESIEFVKKKLLDSDAHIYKILNYSSVEKMLQEHFDGLKNRRLLIWSLLSIQTYLDQQLSKKT